MSKSQLPSMGVWQLHVNAREKFPTKHGLLENMAKSSNGHYVKIPVLLWHYFQKYRFVRKQLVNHKMQICLQVWRRRKLMATFRNTLFKSWHTNISELRSPKSSIQGEFNSPRAVRFIVRFWQRQAINECVCVIVRSTNKREREKQRCSGTSRWILA